MKYENLRSATPKLTDQAFWTALYWSSQSDGVQEDKTSMHVNVLWIGLIGQKMNPAVSWNRYSTRVKHMEI